MAAKLQSSRLAASFGKRFVSQIRSLDSLVTPASLCIRRSVHVSVYDKNPEEQVVRVAEDVIPAQLPAGHYWSPHPQTGVFGPAKDHKPADRGLHVKPSADSVLDQKAFFRPLEDLDKPLHA